jgi:deoxyribonuclease-4
MLMGAHVSAAGGLSTAFDRAEAAECQAMQIFTKSPGVWAAPPLGQDEVLAFRARAAASPVRIAVVHAAYLINIASPQAAIRDRSMEALRIELERVEALGIPFLVLHPGAHMGDGEPAGLRRVVGALDRVLGETAGFRARVLLENSSGQGTSLASRFASLGAVLGSVRDPDRLGVCIDTCHTFAAGYDLRSRAGYEAAVEELRREVGLESVRCVHANDSKRELGSRVDRHEHIGRGYLGLGAFRRLVNDPRFAGLPCIVELPPEGGMDRANVLALRRLVRSARGIAGGRASGAGKTARSKGHRASRG